MKNPSADLFTFPLECNPWTSTNAIWSRIILVAMLIEAFGPFTYAHQFILQGIATVHNSGYRNQGKKEPILGATIIVPKDGYTMSVEQGRFLLITAGIAGKPFGMTCVDPKFEAVNAKEMIGLQQSYAYNYYILMAPLGEIVEAQAKYYNLNAFKASYESLIKMLNGILSEQKLTLAEMQAPSITSPPSAPGHHTLKGDAEAALDGLKNHLARYRD